MKNRKNKKDKKERADILQMAAALLLFVILGALAVWRMRQGDTAAQGFLLREEVGGSAYEKELVLEMPTGAETISLTVEPRERSPKERQALLDAAAQKVFPELLHGMPAAHVDEDLSLSSALAGSPVQLSLMTSKPELIDFDGILADEIPKEGATAELYVTLSLDGEIREETLRVTVVPRKLSGAAAREKEIMNYVNASNSKEEEKLFLPESWEGSSLRWRSKTDPAVFLLPVCGALFLIGTRFAKKERARQEQARRRRALRADYPEITGLLALYLGAGLSLRSALFQLAEEYRDQRRRGDPERPGFSLMAQLCGMMRRGMAEEEAYRSLALSAEEGSYRTLSSLFLQQLTFGSAEMTARLSAEAARAFSERKKEAKIRGEEAGTKLLFPMLLLFADLMMILLIPALLSLRV